MKKVAVRVGFNGNIKVAGTRKVAQLNHVQIQISIEKFFVLDRSQEKRSNVGIQRLTASVNPGLQFIEIDGNVIGRLID